MRCKLAGLLLALGLSVGLAGCSDDETAEGDAGGDTAGDTTGDSAGDTAGDPDATPDTDGGDTAPDVGDDPDAADDPADDASDPVDDTGGDDAVEDAADDASDAVDTSGDGGCDGVELTVLNYLAWCSVSVDGETASSASSQTVCVAAESPITLVAAALGGFELGLWHHTDGDEGDGDPGEVSAGRSTATFTTGGGGDACVWVCCPFVGGSGCPSADQCD